MSNELRNFMGREGFIWWMGVVEDRLDPDQLGRVRVRCFGWHTNDKALIPTNALPWAHSLHSNNVPASFAPKEGDWVVGFFADGPNAQNPIIMGVLNGKPTTKPDTNKGFSDPSGYYPDRVNESTLNRLARGRIDGTVHETRKRGLKKGVKVAGGGSTWNEPSPTFAPEYPYNFAIESESGHAFELDDTEGNERVHIAHKNGSYIEFDAKGNRVEKITKDGFTVIVGNNNVSIDGKCNITITGNCNLKTNGNLNVEAKNINMSASSNIKIKAGSKLMLEGQTLDVKGTGAVKIGSGAKLSLKGKTSVLQGSKVSLAGKITNKVKTKHGIGKIKPSGSAASPASTGLSTSVISVAGVSAPIAAALPTGVSSITSIASVSSIPSSISAVTSKVSEVQSTVATVKAKADSVAVIKTEALLAAKGQISSIKNTATDAITNKINLTGKTSLSGIVDQAGSIRDRIDQIKQTNIPKITIPNIIP